MLFNRSVPPCTVIPVLYYPDVSAAADWLCNAFGFVVRLRIGNHRIQLKAGDGCVVLAEGGAPGDSAHLVMVRVTDARSHCEQARQRGARILADPMDHPTANANTPSRTSQAIAGLLLNPSPTWLQRSGAARPSICSGSHLLALAATQQQLRQSRAGITHAPGLKRCFAQMKG